MRRLKRFLAAMLATLTVLPFVAISASAAVDPKYYSNYFTEHLDFEDLAGGDSLTAAYLNSKIDSADLFCATSDSGGSFAPTLWKAIADPHDPQNTVIGLKDTVGYAMFQIKDPTNCLFEIPFVLGFRILLNEKVNANTTLLGWTTDGTNNNRMRLIGLNGNMLCYATSTTDSNNTETLDGGTYYLEYGRWYEFAVAVYPSSGRVQVDIDGKAVYDFISTTVMNAKPTQSGINICYGWGSSITFNVYLDDITLQSLDIKKIEAEEEDKLREEQRMYDTFVIGELAPYLKKFTYITADATLGCPVGLCSYYKGEKSHDETAVVMYVMGYDGAREVGRGDTLDSIHQLLDEGYAVLTVDYCDDPRATVPNLDWSLFSLRKGIDAYLGGLSHAKFDIYVVPDGYMLARNILFYDYAENAKVGTIEKIISIYNTDNGFRSSRGAKIPNADEKVTSIDRCLKPDGTPVDLQLRLDIVYPVDSPEPAEVVMIASSIETRMQVCVADTNRPLDIGPLMRGCAVVVYDHVYTPMARNDHYGYFSGAFSLQDLTGVSYHTAAVRCARYYADTFGYSKDHYAVMGLSKGSFCGVLAADHPEDLKEYASFGGGNGVATYGEQPFLCYEDGTTIPSNVQVAFRGMGQGDQWRSMYLDGNNAPTLMAIGMLDDIVRIHKDWYNEHNDYEKAGVDYLPITMSDTGHKFPAGVDPDYQYDRWALFMDYFTYYLKEDEAPRIVYSAIVDGELVGDIIVDRENDAGGYYQSHTIVKNDDLFVQFIAPVTEESVKAGLTVFDVTEGREIKVSYRSRGNGNKWFADPMEALVEGHTYELRVSGNITSVLNGKTVGQDTVYRFVK